LVTTPNGGFIRVRKRKLKGLAASSMSFDLVRALRVNGKPRHEFVLGLGSQKDADHDWALCQFWVHAIQRMAKRGLAEDRRQRLIAEMVRKGARVPTIAQCEKFAAAEDRWSRRHAEMVRKGEYVPIFAPSAKSGPSSLAAIKEFMRWPPPDPLPSHDATTQAQGGRS
jgi:hypothetical protein